MTRWACGLWMEVAAVRMSPERVLPEAEDQSLGAGQGAAQWSSDDEEEAASGPELEPSGGGGGGGYHYLPLNQEPSAGPGEPVEPEQDIGERLQELRLYLPEAPVDSEEEEVPEHGSQQSIPMDPEHVELVKRTMAAIKFPSRGVPVWAQEISDEQWQSVVRQTIESRRSVVAAKE